MFRGARIGGVHFEAVPRDFDSFVMVSPGGYTRSSSVRREDVPRAAQHGSFALSAYRDAQTFSIKGIAKRRTPEEMENLELHVRGLCGDGGWDTLAIDEGTGSYWAKVGLSSVDFDILGSDPTIAEFLIQLWSPDPWLLGEVEDFPAGVPAFHRGNFPATPTLLVGAGTGGYTITGPGGRIITVTSAPAAAHEIDFEQGGLFLNGVRQVGAITVFQDWKVPASLPGVTATISGSRSLTQRVTKTKV
ncbi:hypothetical protein [Microbacterium sp. PF5]|uniref:hypothetical protein n=1 Tax=Microbacterium sp. PF5 TaxID=2305435 RepID=UPI00109B9672|nr:hypothetical protein [Microbacterium sp. PF5]